jgi:small conductance mechanosensitive channel
MNLDSFYDKMLDWMLTHGPRILFGIVAFIAGQWLLKMMRKWVTKALHKKELDPSLRPFLLSLLITIFQVLLVLFVMQIFGIQMTVFAAFIGAIGVAVGLALSGTLQNFTSGILILILKPYVVGDSIIAQGQTGTVTSIQIFYTLVVTFDNQTVVIPNSKLSNEVIINLSREGIRRLDIELKLGFAFSFEDIKKIIEKTISQFPDILKDRPSHVGMIAIDPDGYKMAIQIWIKAHGFMDIKLKFQEKLIADLKSSGIKLPGML